MNSAKMKCKTFKEALSGDGLDKIRDRGRKEVLEFINEKVGRKNFVTMTECRSDCYWDCTVWYWESGDDQ